MAEIILAVLCIIAGVVCAGLSVLTFVGNAIGGATNPEDMSWAPTYWLAAASLVAVGGGISIFIF